MGEIIRDEAALKMVELYAIDNVRGGYAASSIERMAATIRANWVEIERLRDGLKSIKEKTHERLSVLADLAEALSPIPKDFT